MGVVDKVTEESKPEKKRVNIWVAGNGEEEPMETEEKQPEEQEENQEKMVFGVQMKSSEEEEVVNSVK